MPIQYGTQPLMRLRPHPQASRISQRDHQEMHPLAVLPNPDVELPKVALGLFARSRLIAHGGDGGLAGIRSPRSNRSGHLLHTAGESRARSSRWRTTAFQFTSGPRWVSRSR